MSFSNLQPKDALVLCTVSILFVYFGLILWTNYAIIIPFWTPLFWAAALSVPLHALKTSLLPIFHDALENDILDMVASAIGGVASYILRFFLGSFIADGLKSVFLGYCYVVYMMCDGRPRPASNIRAKDTQSTEKRFGNGKDAPWNRDYTNEPTMDLEERLENLEDDYELHPSYQTLVDQEPDDFACRSNWPSYTNLLRLAFVYALLQLGSPSELWEFAKTTLGQVQFGTQRQLNVLMIAVLLHIQYSCLGQIISVVERIMYPGLTPEQQKEQSILNTLPRAFRKGMQESLNSTLTTTIVLSTLAVMGVLITVLTVGVVHDVQGIMSQSHHRVMQFRDEQARLGLAGGDDAGYALDSKQTLTRQVDEALSQAYVAGLDWFDPVLKEAFPDLGWGASEWAFQVAHVVVDLEGSAKNTEPSCESILTCQKLSDDTHFHIVDQSPLSAPKNTTDCESSILEQPELWTIPTLESLGVMGIKGNQESTFTSQQHHPHAGQPKAINLSHAKYLLGLAMGYKGFDTPFMLWGFNIFNDLLFRGILFLLGLLTFTGLKVSPLQRIGWMVDQALASSSSIGSTHLSTSTSPGRVLAKSIEFSITGTFLSMFKLSIYHTLFTVAWTHFLAGRVLSTSANFVAVKFAWLTSAMGIVLTLFPIAPNWLVSLPGAIVYFYIYGQHTLEAVAMAVGHLVMSTMVDGAVWDTHVVKSARPGVSSAFWLGLWVFLGGMKWGTKGLLLGPVFFAAVPSIWSALIELRGKPGARRSTISSASHGTFVPTKERLRPREVEEQTRRGPRSLDDEEDDFYSRSSSRNSSLHRRSRSRSKARMGSVPLNGFRREERYSGYRP